MDQKGCFKEFVWEVRSTMSWHMALASFTLCKCSHHKMCFHLQSFSESFTGSSPSDTRAGLCVLMAGTGQKMRKAVRGGWRAATSWCLGTQSGLVCPRPIYDWHQGAPLTAPTGCRLCLFVSTPSLRLTFGFLWFRLSALMKAVWRWPCLREDTNP